MILRDFSTLWDQKVKPWSSFPHLLGEAALNPIVLSGHCSPAPGSTRVSEDHKAEYSETEEVLTLEAIIVAVRSWRIQTGRQHLSSGWRGEQNIFFLHRFLTMFRLLKLQKLVGFCSLWGSAVQHPGFFDRHIPVRLLSLCSLSFPFPAQLCGGKAVYSDTFPDKGTIP